MELTQFSSDSLSAGTLFADRFTIERLLGRGGMGAVYLARDLMLDDEVIALKILHRDLCKDEKHAKRFLREVQLARRVGHQNVVRTFEVGQYAGQLYFTMEYAAGPSLKDRVPGGVYQPFDLIPLLLQICDGLQAIHDLNIIHRDLKPGNIIVTAGDVVKITDFGVARPPRSDLTGHNEVVGSLPYMSPEMWRGVELKAPADLYSLGVMAYELLTGKLPCDDENAAEMMRFHMYESPPHLTDQNPNIPAFLDQWVFRLLEKNPDDRPQSAKAAGELLAELFAPYDFRDKKLQADKKEAAVVLQIDDEVNFGKEQKKPLISRVLQNPKSLRSIAISSKIFTHLFLCVGLIFGSIWGYNELYQYFRPKVGIVSLEGIAWTLAPQIIIAIIFSAPILCFSWIKNPSLWGVGPAIYYFVALLLFGIMLSCGHAIPFMNEEWLKGNVTLEQIRDVIAAGTNNLFEIAYLDPQGTFYRLAKGKLEAVPVNDSKIAIANVVLYYSIYALNLIFISRVLKKWIARSRISSSFADGISFIVLFASSVMPFLALKYNLISSNFAPLKITIGATKLETSWINILCMLFGWIAVIAIQSVTTRKQKR